MRPTPLLGYAPKMLTEETVQETLRVLGEMLLSYFAEDLHDTTRFVYHDNTLTFLFGESFPCTTYINPDGSVNIPCERQGVEEDLYKTLVRAIHDINTMVTKED